MNLRFYCFLSLIFSECHEALVKVRNMIQYCEILRAHNISNQLTATRSQNSKQRNYS